MDAGVIAGIGIVVAIVVAVPSFLSIRNESVKRSALRETLLIPLRQHCDNAFLTPLGFFPFESWRDEHAELLRQAKQADVAAVLSAKQYKLLIEILEGVHYDIERIADFRSESPTKDEAILQLTADAIGTQYEQAFRVLGDTQAAIRARSKGRELLALIQDLKKAATAAAVDTNANEAALLVIESHHMLRALKAEAGDETPWRDIHTLVEKFSADICAKLSDADTQAAFRAAVTEAARLQSDYPFEPRQPAGEGELRQRFIGVLRAYVAAVNGLGDADAGAKLQTSVISALTRPT